MSDKTRQLPESESDLINELADPIIDHLMRMKPTTAMMVLVAVVSRTALSLRHKEGKTALDTIDDHFIPAIRKTVEEHVALGKPHHGRIQNWHKQPCGDHGLGYMIMGTLLDHPTIPVKHTNTSYVVKHDEATGEIETRNSRYRLIGPEVKL